MRVAWARVDDFGMVGSMSLAGYVRRLLNELRDARSLVRGGSAGAVGGGPARPDRVEDTATVTYADNQFSARIEEQGVTIKIVGWSREDVVTFKVTLGDMFLSFEVLLPGNSLSAPGEWTFLGTDALASSPPPYDVRWERGGLYQTMRDCLVLALQTWPRDDGVIVRRDVVRSHGGERLRVGAPGEPRATR